MDSAADPNQIAEDLHALFRGAAEIGKRRQSCAFWFEVAAITTSICAIYLPALPYAKYQPLLGFAILLLSLTTRARANSARGYSEKCRRESARAFALETKIKAIEVSRLRCNQLADRARATAAGLPASNLKEYYEVETPAGIRRLVEMYAHSAFYTWQISRYQSIALCIVALVSLFIAFALIYLLVVDPIAKSSADFILDATFSILLSVFGARSFLAACSYWSTADEAQSIADDLADEKTPAAKDVYRLVNDYNFCLAQALPTSTWIYMFRRRALEREWALRRRDIRIGHQER